MRFKGWVITILSMSSSVVRAESTQVLPSAEQCVQELCGSLKKPELVSLLHTPQHLQRIESDYSEKVFPYLQRSLKHSLQLKREDLKMVAYVTRLDLSGVSLNPDQLAYFNFIKVVELTNELLRKGAVDFGGDLTEIKTNRPNARPIARLLGFKNVEASLSAVDAFFSEGVYASSQWAEEMKISTYKAINFPEMKMELFLAGALDLIIESRQALLKALPFSSVLVPSILKERMELGSITDDDSPLFFDALYTAIAIRKVLRPSKLREALAAMQFDLPKEIKVHTEKLLRPNIAFSFNSGNVVRQWTQAAEMCGAQYRNTMRSYPLESEVNEFKGKKLPGIVSAAKQVLYRQSLSHLAPRLDEIEWKTSLSYEKGLRVLLAELEETEDGSHGDLDRRQELFKKLEIGDPEAKQHAAIAVLAMSESDFVFLFKDELQSCSLVKPTGFIDSIYTNPRHVNVSWQTVLLSDTTVFTISHEIGHLIYSAIKDTPAIEKRSACLSENHGGLEADPTKYANEDFADFFAGSVMKLIEPNPARSLFCYLTPQLTGLRQTNVYDTHSSDLFRLISIAGEIRDLPASCRAVQQEAGMSKPMSRCQ